MNRRGFLTRSGLALGALIVGDEVLEHLARLTHVRKSFPSAAVRSPWRFARVDVNATGSLSPTATLMLSTDGQVWSPHGTREVGSDAIFVLPDGLHTIRAVRSTETIGDHHFDFEVA